MSSAFPIPPMPFSFLSISLSILISISHCDPPPHFLLLLFSPLFTLHLLPHALLPLLHLQLSFIVRIVPSPDWFVGVDGVDLCEGDHWKESVTLELFPYDAGTDSGFTFSSPNFETIPQDKITQVGQYDQPTSIQQSQKLQTV